MDSFLKKFDHLKMQQKFYVFGGGGVLLGCVVFILAAVLASVIGAFGMLLVFGYLFFFVSVLRKVFKCPHCDYPIMISGRMNYFSSPGKACKQCGKEY